MAVKVMGARLSMKERKQKLEKEWGVTATFDASRTTCTTEGSFRVTTATEHAE
ncbi:protein numb homolog isoform 1 [Lynx pardinus]|uniref:Protein numb homolog isoform 1 n=1 Tax=Lynx pardinus TaxID=191816 RepID=A0A485NQK1_LYNPA|nr:protein numb homolog isoform 1 [Lynx pardinus]